MHFCKSLQHLHHMVSAYHSTPAEHLLWSICAIKQKYFDLSLSHCAIRYRSKFWDKSVSITRKFWPLPCFSTALRKEDRQLKRCIISSSKAHLKQGKSGALNSFHLFLLCWLSVNEIYWRQLSKLFKRWMWFFSQKPAISERIRWSVFIKKSRWIGIVFLNIRPRCRFE